MACGELVSVEELASVWKAVAHIHVPVGSAEAMNPSITFVESVV